MGGLTRSWPSGREQPREGDEMHSSMQTIQIAQNRMIEQFCYVTFWHSKVKTNTFIKYHTPVHVYMIKKIHNKKSISITVKTMTSTVKNTTFNHKIIQSYNVHAIHH